MRYYHEKPSEYSAKYGERYICNHPVYSICTLYRRNGKGLAVIQQRFDERSKSTWWDEIDPWLRDEIYLHPLFNEYFNKRAKPCVNGLYPTVSVRQIMWAFKMKPLKKERWETVFDRRDI